MAWKWDDSPKRRSPMDSGNNGTFIDKIIKALTDKKKAPRKGKGK